ncbi:ferritin family protein [Streptomyces sp. A1-5]|uniref:ferritin family protein n=1 Tax=Streptomyces sp. A1-5 TaxID=2738410 RepID=UPI001F48F15E|nr:ferritin family protein [Streptomyces sp. A1-5]UJB44861.1 rubrerythrin family protein [Streptomyces sp. A1-5]
MIPFSMRVRSMGILALMVCVPAGATAAVAPEAASALHAQTRADLDAAMHGEAYAYATYSLFADQAGAQDLPSVRQLFQRTAKVELGEHFAEEAKLDGLAGSDAANLQAAMTGEEYESHTMYPTFAKQARQDGDTAAAGLFEEIAKDESAHHAAFAEALEVVRTGKGTVPAPPGVTPVTVQAGVPRVRAARTKQNLDTALHGEALASAKYTQFAQAATAHGNQALARLFTGTADVERREHFAGEAQLAGIVAPTRQNLTTAINGEQYESRIMYPTYARQAKTAGDAKAAKLFADNANDEAGHARAFENARNQLH